MSFSLYRLSWGFSALFISMTIIGCGSSSKVQQEAQTQQAQSHDYQNAFIMGMSAADRCYQYKEIDECDNLIEIEKTLSTWCSQNDPNACKLYVELMGYEASISMVEKIEP